MCWSCSRLPDTALVLQDPSPPPQPRLVTETSQHTFGHNFSLVSCSLLTLPLSWIFHISYISHFMVEHIFHNFPYVS